MSKAMDALDRLISLAVYGSACVNAACKAPECVEAKTALALLRDYITTTEAERAAKEACGVVPCPECGGDGADHEDSSENCWNCNGDGVVRDTRNPMSASDESAARIKELEGALTFIFQNDGLDYYFLHEKVENRIKNVLPAVKGKR